MLLITQVLVSQCTKNVNEFKKCNNKITMNDLVTIPVVQSLKYRSCSDIVTRGFSVQIHRLDSWLCNTWGTMNSDSDPEI